VGRGRYTGFGGVEPERYIREVLGWFYGQ